jgi:hypothetical protein
MDPMLQSLISWSIEGVIGILVGTCVFFVKRLVDQLEKNRSNLHKLREVNQEWRSAADLELQRIRSAIRIIADRCQIKHQDIEELCDERLPANPQSDSTLLN